MKHLTLNGWNVSVTKTQIKGLDADASPLDGWKLTFSEMIPQTGDTISFSFGQEGRDYIVRELTGGIILHGGDLPKL